jgi:hypothetical protein
MSAAHAENLIRHYTEVQGIDSGDIALFCGNNFLHKVKLHCGGNIKAEVNNYPLPGKHYNHYNIVISTIQELAVEYPTQKKILLNYDNKIDTAGWDEVYSYYTDTDKRRELTKEYPLFKELKNRNWQTLFETYPDFYRRNYMYLTTDHFYMYITLYPETIREDGLWIPIF